MRQLHDPDFIERNGGWILSMVGIVGACFSGCFVYMLKSRCKHIKCWGVECERDVLAIDSATLEPIDPAPLEPEHNSNEGV